jgi:hypothetical protein
LRWSVYRSAYRRRVAHGCLECRCSRLSGCFAAISLIEVILVWQVMLSLSVFLNHGVENLDPFFKANGMIFGDVSGFGARAVIEQNTRTLVERGKLRCAACALFYRPRITHEVATKINISG